MKKMTPEDRHHLWLNIRYDLPLAAKVATLCFWHWIRRHDIHLDLDESVEPADLILTCSCGKAEIYESYKDNRG